MQLPSCSCIFNLREQCVESCCSFYNNAAFYCHNVLTQWKKLKGGFFVSLQAWIGHQDHWENQSRVSGQCYEC